MNMTLNLTYEDGRKIVEAMKETAIENGWDAEELDECGVIEEYCGVVDAALAAMGIAISIDGKSKVEDENKYCDSAADCYFCNSNDEEWSEDDDEEDEDFDEDDFEDEDEDEDDDEDDDEELPSDEEVMNLIMRVLYGQ